MRRRLVAALALLAGALSTSALAADDSQQPYIDSIKADLPPEEKTSHIEEVKQGLPAEEPGESHIEKLKKELGPAPAQERSYSEEMKGKVEPRETGGAIAAYHEGRSQLKPRFEGEARSAFGFRYAAVTTRNVEGAPAGRSFQEVYGARYAPELGLFFEYRPWHNEGFASFGLLGDVGLSYFQGTAMLQFDLAKPGGGTFGTTSRTQLQFFIVPLTLAGSVRLNFMKYVRPYLTAGPSLIGYMEHRDNGTSDKWGYSGALMIRTGAAFLLDFLSANDSWETYAQNGVKHTYLTAEYVMLSPLFGDIRFSNSSVSLGFTFEY